jgi:hypothetical protein
MKKVFLLVLCFFFVAASAQAGAEADSAKQDENPRHAGKSSVYFYDVDATDTHGSGQLVIDLDKHTFVFIGKDFMPYLQIQLEAKEVGGTDYAVFASGKATPSGNVHIAGTWESDAAPEEVVCNWEMIGGFSLTNNGWFIAQIACYYSTDDGVTWHESDHSSNITIGNWEEVYLEDLGVPDYAWVKIHVIVVAGKDRTHDQVYQYVSWMGNCGKAYFIKGTTWNPKLSFDGSWCH